MNGRGKAILIGVLVIVAVWLLLAIGARIVSAAVVTPANTQDTTYTSTETIDGDVDDPLWKAHGFACRTMGVIVTRHDIFGNDLFKAKWTQHFCFNGKYVANVKPLHVKGWTTGWGDTLGWTYRGVIAGDRKGKYLNHHQSHMSWAKVQFVECVPSPSGCTPDNVQEWPGRMRVYSGGGMIFDWKP